MFEHSCYERRPACLVIGPQPAPGIRVKVLVKQHQVFPMRIVGISLLRAVTWFSSLLVFLEKQYEPSFDFVSDLSQVHQDARPRWAFYLKLFTVKIVILPKRFDNQIVEREPDGATPVAVATKHPCVALTRYVTDRFLAACVFEHERFVTVDR